ncbi:hypothetical protein Elgi_51560 [Paenibacillus elgii]|uniref:hypothetical protein n=1 Tax=Paenibacillus elgii TaxID=189691 RepID=UPI002D7BCACE|nr:hypothetical protein Elgi_51560 [Paenibacillus elgii]
MNNLQSKYETLLEEERLLADKIESCEECVEAILDYIAKKADTIHVLTAEEARIGGACHRERFANGAAACKAGAEHRFQQIKRSPITKTLKKVLIFFRTPHKKIYGNEQLSELMQTRIFNQQRRVIDEHEKTYDDRRILRCRNQPDGRLRIGKVR